MKSERIPFQPIGDIDDKLEQLARDKGVSTMVKPQQEEEGAKATEEASVAASRRKDSPKVVATQATTAHPESEATPRSRMKSVNMELPDYAWTELKIRSAHQQTSVRHIIMAALQKDGFTINEIDMVEDGRRLRGRDLAQ